MRGKTHPPKQQVMMLVVAAKDETVPPEVRAEIVRALADLLLAALHVEKTTDGGGDEPEDHA